MDEKCAHMKSTEELLEIVGNDTRRRMLTVLSEGPCYVSEISKKLNVTQPAILKHLSVLEGAGLIEVFWKKNPLGADRKYYKICDSVRIEIAINPQNFKIERKPQRGNCPTYLEKEPTIKQLTEEINKASNVADKAAKAEELAKIADSLISCTSYQKESWDCENCHRIALLRKEASQIILHVCRGDVDTGLRKLGETIDKLVNGLDENKQ
jgi:predicted transcriptional regulator